MRGVRTRDSVPELDEPALKVNERLLFGDVVCIIMMERSESDWLACSGMRWTHRQGSLPGLHG